jgi:hypothetical protein
MCFLRAVNLGALSCNEDHEERLHGSNQVAGENHTFQNSFEFPVALRPKEKVNRKRKHVGPANNQDGEANERNQRNGIESHPTVAGGTNYFFFCTVYNLKSSLQRVKWIETAAIRIIKLLCTVEIKPCKAA